MEARLSPHLDQTTLDANLKALGEVDPAAAARIAQVRVPDGVVAAATHDGLPTFLLPQEGDRPPWLGRTGAPSARAEALLSRFDPGSGNVLLVGAGQGELLSRLADSLPAHQAVFVYEPGLLALRLVLALHDLSPAIRNRRIVFAVGGPDDDCEAALSAAVLANRGHLVPERMMSWPWLTPRDTATLATLAQRVADRVSAARAGEMDRIRRLNESWASSAEGRENVLVCTASVAADTGDWMEHIARTLREMGVGATTFQPRQPGRRHPLALLDTLVETRPAVVILVDCLRSEVHDLLPSNLRAVSWLGPDAVLSKPARPSKADADVCYAASAFAARRAVAAGVPKARVELLPLGVAPSEHEPPSDAADAAQRVVVFADAADCSPQAHGIELGSHVALWHALCAAIRADPEAFGRRGAESYLREAERRAHVVIRDARLRTRFLEAAAGAVLPALRRAKLLETLAGGGVRFQLWGAGWHAFPVLVSYWQGRLGAAGSRLAAIDGASVVIDLEARGEVRFHHLVALSLGSVVLLESPRHRGKSTPWQPYWQGGQGPPTWSSPEELLALTRELVRSPARRRSLSEALQQHCLTRCRLETRLTTLLASIGIQLG